MNKISLSKLFRKVIPVGTILTITKQATSSFVVTIKNKEGDTTKAFGKTITSAIIQAGKNLGVIKNGKNGS